MIARFARAGIVLSALTAAALLGGCNTNKSTENESAYTPESLKMQSEAATAFSEIMAIDPSLNNKFYQTCYAYAVFPKVGRAGVGIGGAGGEGVVFRGNNVIIGTASLEQVTFGAQVGAQNFQEVIFFKDAATLERFRAGPTEFSANVSAVLIKNGSGAANNYVNGVAIFVRPTDGLMAEMSLGGQKFWYRPANAQ